MKKGYLIIFFLSLFLRLFLAGLILFNFGEQGFIGKGDAVGQYLPLAKNFALGKGFTLDGVTPYAYKAPGYPLYLAFFYKIFGVFWPALIVQIIFSASLAVFIFKIGGEIGLERKVSWIAAVLTATAPHLIYYSNFYVTESLFAFLFILGIWFFIRFLKEPNLKYALLSGVFLGLDTLTKVSVQYLPFVFLPFLIFLIWKTPRETRKKFILLFVVFFLVFIAVFAPLAIRNYKHFGTFNLNSQGVYLLYRYEGASIVFLRDKISFGEAERLARRELLEGTGLENTPEEQLVDLKYAPILFEKTLNLMKRNMSAVAKIELINILSFWTHNNYAYLLSIYKIIPSPSLEKPPAYLLAMADWRGIFNALKLTLANSYYSVALLSRLFWILVAFFGVLAFFFAVFGKRMTKEQKFFVFFLFLIVVYFNAVLFPLGFGGEARLRYHVEPFMFLLAGFGCIISFSMLSKKQIRKSNIKEIQ